MSWTSCRTLWTSPPAAPRLSVNFSSSSSHMGRYSPSHIAIADSTSVTTSWGSSPVPLAHSSAVLRSDATSNDVPAGSQAHHVALEPDPETKATGCLQAPFLSGWPGIRVDKVGAL